MVDGESSCPRFRVTALKLPLVIAATLVLSVLIYRHTPGIDGPWYAHYGWHRARASTHLGLMIAAALPMVAGLLLFEMRAQRRPVLPIVLLMMSVVGFVLTNITHLGGEPSWWPMIELIENPMALSYFADAAALVSGPGTLRDWLVNWPALMGEMYLHSQTKPPGPVLYFAMFVNALGVTHRAAVMSGLVLAGVISMVVPATYWLARVVSFERPTAFHAAVCMALFPSIVLFFPSLDGAYAAGSCLLLGLCVLAVKHGSIKAAMAFGAVLALMMFFVYNILVIGAVLAAWGWLVAPHNRLRVIFRCAIVSLVTCAALYLVLWIVSGFDPIATFRSALHNQSRLLPGFDRPYPSTILFDLTDFALGVGWIAVGLALLGASSSGSRRGLIIAGLLQLVIVALTGLLPGETARVWGFMTPLVALPAGAELARWGRAQRWACFACMFVLLGLLSQNLSQTHGTNAPLVGQTRPSSK